MGTLRPPINGSFTLPVLQSAYFTGSRWTLGTMKPSSSDWTK